MPKSVGMEGDAVQSEDAPSQNQCLLRSYSFLVTRNIIDLLESAFNVLDLIRINNEAGNWRLTVSPPGKNLCRCVERKDRLLKLDQTIFKTRQDG
jgi:hypothetical protein